MEANVPMIVLADISELPCCLGLPTSLLLVIRDKWL